MIAGNTGRYFSLSITAIIIILLCYSVHAQVTGESEQKYIPDIETFMKIGRHTSPQITADGRTLFFYKANIGSAIDNLYRLTDEGWPYQLTLFEEDIDFYSVSPDGSKAIVGISIGGSEDYQLFLVDTRTGRTSQLTEQPSIRYGSVHWKADNSAFYFRANMENPRDYYFYEYNLINGTDRRIMQMEGSNFIYDISPDGNLLLFEHNYSNVANDLFILNLDDLKISKITPDKDNVIYDTPFFLNDNKTIFLVCNDNPEGLKQLAQMDIASDNIEFLGQNTKWAVDLVEASPNRKYMAWQTNEAGYSSLKLWDIENDREIPAPPMKGMLTSPSFSNKGLLTFQYTSSTTTADIYIWDWKTPELRKMTYANYAGIDPSVFADPELITYNSFDGLEIPAFLYLPENYDGRPIPFIVHAHGGPEGQFRPYLQRHFQYLLLNGFGIIAPNVRGSIGYDEEYVNLDNYKNRLHSIKDYRAAVEYLFKNNYSAPGLVGIKGTSYGGYVVLACITEYPELFSAAIDHVGIANFVTFLQNTRTYRRHIREAEYGPLSDPEFLKSISPIHKADKIKIPLLVVHGENDPRVPVGEARQIIEAVEGNGGVVESLIFDNEGHGITKKENRMAYYRSMADFFKRYLIK